MKADPIGIGFFSYASPFLKEIRKTFEVFPIRCFWNYNIERIIMLKVMSVSPPSNLRIGF
jgi:hypothetical protein